MIPQVVSPHDPAIAKRNRITLAVLLLIVAGLLTATYAFRGPIYHAMMTDQGAHGKR
jgi:hypothetical protein